MCLWRPHRIEATDAVWHLRGSQAVDLFGVVDVLGRLIFAQAAPLSGLLLEGQRFRLAASPHGSLWKRRGVMSDSSLTLAYPVHRGPSFNVGRRQGGHAQHEQERQEPAIDASRIHAAKPVLNWANKSRIQVKLK